MPSPKRKIGDVGEGVACKYLEQKGYKILERNYWKPWGEIDIVAKKAGILSFIEVKSISRGTIRPEENMHLGKMKRLNRAIQTYLLDRKVSETTHWQVTLVCVVLNFETKRAKVELLENIVL
jgi:putative endonuclease